MGNAKTKKMTNYLTEERLEMVLGELFPNVTFIRDRQVPNSGLQTRPDYRNDDLKLIVEFDGDQHYRNVQKIKREQEKTDRYSQMGYKVVRIPYFIQISTETITHLFDINLSYNQTYPHGFISKTVIMPADFCEIGIQKFKSDLKRFDYLQADILNSLKQKVEILGDKELVLPPSLYDLIN
jgi:very-short-patch-repair endonuclease